MSIPGSASPLFFQTAAGDAAAFQIDRSLRFNSGDSAYLNRTPSSAGNRRTFTWSGWVKRTVLGADKFIFSAGGDASNFHYLRFTSSDTLEATEKKGDAVQSSLITTAVYRDPSAWMHILYVYNSTESTAADRLSLYVNGAEVTSFGTSTYPSQNHDTFINNNITHYINTWSAANGHADAYLTEIQLLDGTAVSDASDFGEYDSNNVWQPKDTSSLTFGTNGFRLKFDDNSSNSALGNDSSGNDNDWTVNNFSVASGAGNDSLIDSPTNYSADSGNPGGNYCTLNPLKNQSQTLKNGNLESNGTSGRSTGTLYASSGKFYWEFTAGTSYTMSGIESSTSPQAASYAGENDQQYALYGNNGSGQLYHNGSISSFDGFVSGDVIGVALDMDGGNLYFYKNGSAMNSGNAAATGLTGAWTANCRSGSGAYNGDTAFNFGQRPFAHTPPTGYVSLCTTNLPDPTIADGSTAFIAKKFTANASNQTITTGFSPDFVWVKSRANAYGHEFYDILRGTNKRLTANTSANEQNLANQLTSFNSDGFTLGNASSSNYTNNTTSIAWAWDGGTSTASNTDGSITSNVRASQANGFSIVTWTAASNSVNSIGHGLNAAPGFVITKSRTASNNWRIWHSATGKDKYLGFDNAGASSFSNFWSTSEPTSSTFGVWNATGAANNDGDMVALVWAPVEGYSKFGSYTGNGSSDGPFVFTGMRPKWLLIKATTGSKSWYLYDTARSEFNVTEHALKPDNTDAEGQTSNKLDILSNGFKWRNSGTSSNVSGVEYIYAAFAEHPFKTARAR